MTDACSSATTDKAARTGHYSVETHEYMRYLDAAPRSHSRRFAAASRPHSVPAWYETGRDSGNRGVTYRTNF